MPERCVQNKIEAFSHLSLSTCDFFKFGGPQSHLFSHLFFPPNFLIPAFCHAAPASSYRPPTESGIDNLRTSSHFTDTAGNQEVIWIKFAIRGHFVTNISSGVPNKINHIRLIAILQAWCQPLSWWMKKYCLLPSDLIKITNHFLIHKKVASDSFLFWA